MRNQYLSRPDVKDYLAKYLDATKEEKAELLQWLKQGNSPYSNDRYVFDEFDRPADFIGAIRAEQEYYEEEWRIRLTAENRMCNILSVPETVSN